MPSESYAYASVNKSQNLMSRFSFFCRQHSTALLASVAFLFFIFFVSSESVQKQPNNLRNKSQQVGIHPTYGGGVHWGGAYHDGYFTSESSIDKGDANTFHFAMVTDLDQLSRVNDNDLVFYSKLLPSKLKYHPSDKKYTVEFDTAVEPRILKSKHNEGGRGMELSELVLYNNRLLAFDDRTGCVFEVLSKPQSNGLESYVVPRFVITEGDGDTDKGMKWEWATVKDSLLYIGSMGKEYTKPNGDIENTNNLWIATIDPKGQVERIDWAEQYNFVRHALEADSPGYVMHEAVIWSEHLKKWFFLPRRISSKMYNEFEDERMGSNKIVIVDEDFTTYKIVDIPFAAQSDGLHGFSTVAFVPGTNDQHAMAVRSVEEDCVGGDDSKCKQRSYVTVFDVESGAVLMDEVQVGLNLKFEGLEFVDVSVADPFH